MGFRERHATRPADRYSAKLGSNEALYAPVRPPERPRAVGRPDLAQLLGRTVLEARVQRAFQEYGLLPRTGTAGSGLSRSYRAPQAGVEIAADAHGTVTTVTLHFTGTEGFTPYQGTIPAGAGSMPHRSRIWAMLGRPDQTGAPYRDRHLAAAGPWDRWQLPEVTLHARYATDAERLERLTLSLPDHLPRAA
ncbi:hypothetical protein [Actinoplanes sp. TFC3]|uniref:hypothetical protein n=1 Tax=Actinoplanes sp. TFC3 TaxID=1710355 RepID=UPI00082AD421|nr:hypothetical protein [Actinoplanes sp. TFC3]